MANIQRAILEWYDQNKRNLPWRDSKNPYFIWISEVVLQQTRVEQGAPFFHRLIEAFPSVQALAAATEQEVLTVWKGLGYYSRARNLHKAAQEIITAHSGVFPSDFLALKKLPGVGEYTAAALSSISFNKAIAAVDGNVIRVVSRLLDLSEPVDTSQTSRTIKEFANEILSPTRPGDFNQAMMDFGSMVCTPKSPSCASCPLATVCLARINNTQHLRPVKKPKKKAINRFLLFKVQLQEGKIRMIQQQKGSIWENLFLFPFDEFSSEAAFLAQISQESQVINDRAIHVLSHQRLHYAVVMTQEHTSSNHEFWFSRDELYDLPTPILVPRILTRVENQLAPLF
jgi:A/G-specific adenine glycosylase